MNDVPDMPDEPQVASPPVIAADSATRDRDVRVLAMKVCDATDDRGLMEKARDLGIDEVRLRRVMDDENFLEKVWQEGLRWVLVPEIPEIMRGLARKCRKGNAQAIRLYMEILGKAQKQEGDKHVHLHYMENRDLRGYAAELLEEVRELAE